MKCLFDRYREFMEHVEDNMDHVLGTRSRGHEIRDAASFREFWNVVCGNPAMRLQWERRLADHGFERERDAIRRLVQGLTVVDASNREAA